MDEETADVKEKKAASPQKNQDNREDQEHGDTTLLKIERITLVTTTNVRELSLGSRCLAL
jgi:hypothetical protein